MQSLLDQQKAAALAALPRCDLLQAAAALPAAEAGKEEEQEEEEEGEDARAGEQAGLSAEQAAAAKLLTAAVTSHRQAGAGADPPPVVCAVVATLAAHSAQHLLEVLLHMARQQPELAAHLLLHSLDPAGWELLSGAIERRQEELAAESGWPGRDARSLALAHGGASRMLSPLTWLPMFCAEHVLPPLTRPPHICRQHSSGGGCSGGPVRRAVQVGGWPIAQHTHPLWHLTTAMPALVSISMPANCLYNALGSSNLRSCADRHELLDAILQRKEAFSRQALRAVLETELAGAL